MPAKRTPPSFLQRALLLLASYAVSAHAWSFSIERQPETCIGIIISWSDGVPPWTFTFLHPPAASSDMTNLSTWSTGASVTYTEQKAYPASVGGMGMGISQAEFTPLIVVGSDGTGFGSGGTSQVIEVLPEQAPFLPGCATTPPNNATFPSYLKSFDFSSVTTCGTVTATHNGSLSGTINVDTIVPLGQSFRTTLNASASNMLTWYLPTTAGTNVSFAFSTPGAVFGASLVVTPLMTVQQGVGNCGASGTLSSATALPSAIPYGSTSGVRGDKARVGILWVFGLATAVALPFGMVGR
ncbi:hypothetical protein CALCODRAFT_499141 [Calocera cornea HHB12733]|uniref:Uncharacterized protein n=1 Tax=Calocera cornea HHB12733 TaxID=1353952 RepID=A0A165EIT8_9BASI|nr:hypothetical protein CALCODRAFT_499141 [Calocera cornea HHB12733]